MAVTQAEPVPYAPASAVLEIISRRRHRSLPTPINADVLGRASISPSLIPRTLQALKILDLIDDDGNPTLIFEAIRTSPEAEYQRRLEEWLKGAYAEVFAFVDPVKDDEIKIRDAFRSYNPAGQQERMVTLYQGLCAAAGLIPEKATPASPRSRGPAAPTNRPQGQIARRWPPAPPPKHTKSAATGSLPPALSGLLESLPNASDGWTKDERTKFITTFQAVLDFCIPVVAAHKTTENGGPE
jgi:hypothetical protein